MSDYYHLWREAETRAQAAEARAKRYREALERARPLLDAHGEGEGMLCNEEAALAYEIEQLLALNDTKPED